MIRISKRDIPEILQQHQLEWTASLVNLVKQYDGYDKIPEGIKREAVNKYRHAEIKKAVIEMTEGKCVFCESYIEDVDYTNIEHFYPKSLYPKFTFKWSNLFPACRKCNILKDNFDTKINSFIHPLNDNGEEFFEYDNLKIMISRTAPDRQKAFNTIDKCNLDRITLCRQHSEILLTFYDVENAIEKEIKHYNKLTRSKEKIKSCMNILDSVDNLKSQTRSNMPFSGFLRFVIKRSSVVSDAINIINIHRNEIGLTNDYYIN